MVQEEHINEYPYCFCKNCGKLFPVVLLEALGLYQCRGCLCTISPEKDKHTALVWLSPEEAKVRGLRLVGRREEK